MEQPNSTFWRRCSSCKNPIGLGSRYYVCSVSTCNNPRTGYAFCGVPCFERHLPGARHKDAGAVEKTAPMTPFVVGSAPTVEAPRPAAQVFATAPPAAAPQNSGPAKAAAATPKEVLVIASRFKDYIQARSEFNTSQSVMDVLSDHLRVVADRAIANARSEGRKTVMDRDFAFLKQS